MRFCCPDCGRDEEILLDRDPCCRFCRVKMILASHYSDVWMSPYIVIKRMVTISETYGFERASKDGRFKKEREAWTTAVLALALEKLTGEEWWIEIETVETTPDTKLRRVDQHSGRNIIQTRSIEVVDWEENVDDIMEVIGKKCKRGYPGHYLLAVNARHSGKVLNIERITREIKGIPSPFLEIWVLACIGLNQIKVVRITPSGPAIDLKLQDELQQASKQPAFLQRGVRGTQCGFRELGLVYLPIP